MSFSSGCISLCLCCTLAQSGGLKLSVSVATRHQCDSVAFHLSSRFDYSRVGFG